MIYASIGFLAAAALVGGFMVTKHFRGLGFPLKVAGLHGVLAVAGVLCLAAFVVTQGSFGLAGLALVVLGVAAIGGVLNLTFHLRRKPFPTPLLLAHLFVAATGVVLLLAAAF